MQNQFGGSWINRWKHLLTWSLISRVLILVFLGVLIRQGAKMVQMYQEKIRVEKQLEELKIENQKLEAEKAELADPKVLEQVARKELGLVRPGESPYVK